MSKFSNSKDFPNRISVDSNYSCVFLALLLRTRSYFVNLMWFVTRSQNGQSFAGGPPHKPNFQLPSDLALLDDPATAAIVRRFSLSERAFFRAFVTAYKKMANL